MKASALQRLHLRLYLRLHLRLYRLFGILLFRLWYCWVPCRGVSGGRLQEGYLPLRCAQTSLNTISNTLMQFQALNYHYSLNLSSLT